MPQVKQFFQRNEWWIKWLGKAAWAMAGILALFMLKGLSSYMSERYVGREEFVKFTATVMEVQSANKKEISAQLTQMQTELGNVKTSVDRVNLVYFTKQDYNDHERQLSSERTTTAAQLAAINTKLTGLSEAVADLRSEIRARRSASQ